ncbi:PREDICTED: uncharacterized protein LOC109332761 [Lupinus angustifolius]|uniref:uncharacterized protein LOC109332761 n=1 Tax=Lupinus angustifolius TaxID=3871 RepID=UPI00092FB938|nr:PREDICTED: uncharacterized protein LOC109332761 [Lupinus angustifolius]
MTILSILCLFLVIYKVDATSSHISRLEELELERHLKLINKTPIRTIQTKFGDIIDCVDIKKQPAFYHPLLKNHKLQRMPSFENKRRGRNEEGVANRSSEFEKVLCPIGSVPIRRTTKDDLIRIKSISTLTRDFPQSHFAAVYTKKWDNNNYYGVNANVNVYNPRVKNNQMSNAQIAVQNGESYGINSILFGWQVAPRLYGRKSTHIFALWTRDTFNKTGCYNMLCQGFIQIHKSIFLGIRVRNVSSYGGPQFEFSLSISQDPYSKNWWLIIDGKSVGYFPSELFSNMSRADVVGWGGRVYGVVDGTSPQMGSGYFPDGNLRHACFMRRISYIVSGSLQLEQPNQKLLHISVDNSNCYNVKYLGFLDENNRDTIQFGGPGGDCGL